MEIHPGVVVSSTATEAWEPDPEVGGEAHVLVGVEGAYAGLSRELESRVGDPWTLPERETLLILGGQRPRRDRRWTHAGIEGRRHRLDPEGCRHHLARHGAIQGAVVLRATLRRGSRIGTGSVCHELGQSRSPTASRRQNTSE